jgi:ribA/ribD-fused uncharacterized protein
MKIREFQDNYRWLSNFASCEIYYEGLWYSSTEAAYQAAKSLDPDVRLDFSTMKAGQAKRAGRSIVVREDWDDVKIEVMNELLIAKFSKEPYMSKLILTGNMEIEEGNKWEDKFWGICLKTGEGQNNLGKLLMKIREDLIKIGEKYV